MKKNCYKEKVHQKSFKSASKYKKLTQLMVTLKEIIYLVRKCACQRVRNVTFLENFAYVLNEWSQDGIK